MIIVCTIFANTVVAENTWDPHIALVAFLAGHAEEMGCVHQLNINVIYGNKLFISYLVLGFAANSEFDAWDAT